MDKNEAKQVIESYGVIEVRYNHSPIWIEQINDDDTAEVTDLDTNIRMEVPIADLDMQDNAPLE